MDHGQLIILAGVLALWLVVMAVYYSIRWLIVYVKWLRSDSRKRYIEHTTRRGSADKG